MTGQVGSDEMVFFRYVVSDSNKLVSVLVRAIGGSGDPDVYVTNKFEGLIGATKESYTWKSQHSGNDRIDIHPEDVERERGNTLVIGIVGYCERNAFELEVCCSTPAPIRPVTPNSITDIPVEKGKYSYYSIDVDSGMRGKILLTLRETPASAAASTEIESEQVISAVNHKVGRGVYCSDSLASIIVGLDDIGLKDPESIVVRTKIASATRTSRGTGTNKVPASVDGRTNRYQQMILEMYEFNF